MDTLIHYETIGQLGLLDVADQEVGI